MACYIKSKVSSTELFTELSRFDRDTNYINKSTELLSASLNSMNYSALTVEPDCSVSLLAIHCQLFQVSLRLLFSRKDLNRTELVPLSGL